MILRSRCPGDGRKGLAGSSALIRHSMAVAAKLRHPPVCSVSGVAPARCGSAPGQDRSPVIASVTGCSTCMTGVHFDEVEFATSSYRNSMVPAPRYPISAIALADDDAAHLFTLFLRTKWSATVLLQAPSGGGAAANNRAHPDGWHCLCRRRKSGTRCGADRRDIFRDRRWRRQRRPLASDPACCINGFRARLRTGHDLHPATATAGGCLDDHRDSRRPRREPSWPHRSSPRSAPSEPGTSGRPNAACGHLRHGFYRPSSGYVQASGRSSTILCCFDNLGEAGVFRQEAVARMNCVGVGDFGR